MVCECVKDHRLFFIQHVSSFLHLSILLSAFHLFFFSFWPKSTLQAALIRLPIYHIPLWVFYPQEPPPHYPTTPPLCMWARGMDKNVGQETVISWHHSFLFLLAHFLEIHFILYSAQSVRRPFRLFWFTSCPYMTWCSVMIWTPVCKVSHLTMLLPPPVCFCTKTKEANVYSTEWTAGSRQYHLECNCLELNLRSNMWVSSQLFS